jgi:phosphomethylpyrimidine synthase
MGSIYECFSDECIRLIAGKEKVSPQVIHNGIKAGSIVVLGYGKDSRRAITVVGNGVRTKINANIGTSPGNESIEIEKDKLFAALRAGADAVMDLSTGGDLSIIRRMVLENSTVPVGTVPIYQAACELVKNGRGVITLEAEHLFSVIEEQAEEGVDFVTVHCGITMKTVNALKAQKRIAGVVSRGGSFLVRWIEANQKENPLYEQYDRLLDIASKYGVVLSLGDGLRPGCIHDANDQGQIAELTVLGELVTRARNAGVQVIVEGPGHMQLDQIQSHVQMARKLSNNAPLYFLGPLPTDVAAGYDHITSAIGGAIAASAGVDFLCCVSPAEHLRLPNADDVYQGVIASRIAAHAADIVKRVPGARQWDDELSAFRRDLDWESQEKLALDPEKFAQERKKAPVEKSEACTMCGEFCAIRN